MSNIKDKNFETAAANINKIINSYLNQEIKHMDYAARMDAAIAASGYNIEEFEAEVEKRKSNLK